MKFTLKLSVDFKAKSWDEAIELEDDIRAELQEALEEQKKQFKLSGKLHKKAEERA